MAQTIADSSIYTSINTGDKLNKLIFEAMKNGQVLTQDQLAQSLVTISKSFKYPTKPYVMDAFKRGQLVLLYSPDHIRIPSFLPFIINKSPDGKLRAVVFVDTHGSMDKEKNVTIDPKKLFTIMEAAYIGLLYARSPKEFNTKTALIKYGSEIYANIFIRTLNRKYALNTDKVKFHKVMFLASKFFMINVLGREDSDLVNNYAKANCVGGNQFILDEMANMTKPEDFKDIYSFIYSLTREEYNLGFGSELNARSFTEQFVSMYGHSMLLGLELYPYFVLNINSAVHGSYVNNQYTLEDIVEKSGVKQYTEIVKLVR